MTHDSIGLGEDGPTHQPVEHLAALRAIPNLHRVPPGRRDGNRRMLADWRSTATTAPSTLALTRQNLPRRAHRVRRRKTSAPRAPTNSPPPRRRSVVTIFATGSEVEIALEARDSCWRTHGHPTRVVSVPCFELFEQQSDDYRKADHRRRAGQASPSRPPSAGLGPHHRRRRHLHRHEWLRRQRPRSEHSTSISASPPRRSSRRPSSAAREVKPASLSRRLLARQGA